MYQTKKFTKRFDTSQAEDMLEYEKILNNPNAHVLDRMKEKIADREMDPETGRIISIRDRVEFVLTWQERTLL